MAVPHFGEHPRLRGDDVPNWRRAVSACGTPPPARGRHFAGDGPAGRYLEHPRLRGDDLVSACCKSFLAREHPRLRGDDTS